MYRTGKKHIYASLLRIITQFRRLRLKHNFDILLEYFFSYWEIKVLLESEKNKHYRMIGILKFLRNIQNNSWLVVWGNLLT